MPAVPRAVSGQPAQIARAADGHYWAEADIDGRAIRLLVDTGASVVALTAEDARAAGLIWNPAELAVVAQGAGGPAHATWRRLADRVRAARGRTPQDR